ncbi:hypothetical protein AVEN_69203-1 [Araneus ventricosus]|uniref:Uncharacterized protein n=1 Tax=Araneus ventricosus TaxID=182803 RepID=A0A4Y2MGG4_ARAVE|nr:hypothetical protein AVEN_69203-1 [Araneus ventricosus]
MSQRDLQIRLDSLKNREDLVRRSRQTKDLPSPANHQFANCSVQMSIHIINPCSHGQFLAIHMRHYGFIASGLAMGTILGGTSKEAAKSDMQGKPFYN